jgi:hypothetical protein
MSCASEIADVGRVSGFARSVLLGVESVGNSFLRGSVHQRSIESDRASPDAVRRLL